MAAVAEILSPDEKTPVDDDPRAEGKLTVADLCRMFEESEDASNDARKEAERDRDYLDGKQLTAEELSVLAKRGQPPLIDNVIKTKIDYLVGLEKQQGINPKCMPRTMQHEHDAQGATHALNYVTDEQDYDHKRSGVWKNMLAEGAGGFRVWVEPPKKGYGRVKIHVDRIAWDRMYWDPHSSETDFSDANYLGLVTWMDYDDALRMYPGEKEALDATLQGAPSDTYDDKPKFNHWADKKRKRVRICQKWIRRNDEYHFAEFTKGGILKAGKSPHITDQDESDTEFFFQASYKDRDNNTFGLVREMITLQDGINKRGSKALHLVSTNQTWIDEDALPGGQGGIEKLRKEANRADGTIVLNPGSLANNKVKSETRLDLAEAQFKLLQEAKNSIDLKGPNATAMGDKAQGSAAASGRAIIASQQGGMVSLGDLLDNLRHLDVRVFRAIWARIRQYWKEPEWIRVTDDERNIKWVGMNFDPAQVQMALQQNPQMQGKIAGVIGNVAELDCDIIIDEAPDSVAPALEQFQALAELKKFDVNNELPFRALIQAAPNLRDKDKVFEEMDKAKQNQGPPPEIQKAQMDAQIAQQKAQTDAQIAAEKIQTEAALKHRQHQDEAQLEAVKAEQEIRLAREKAEAELALKREIAAAEMELKAQSTAIEVDQKDRAMKQDHEHQEKKFKFESSMKRKEAGMSDDETADKVDSEVMKALKRIEELTAQAHKAASAPRRTKLIRDKNGRPSESISTIDA